MSTYYESCCDRLPGDCICEDEEVTAVDEDGTEARLVRSHGGFADLLTALAESLKKPVTK